ncbi:hypothetical protein HYPSUDRAFT_56735 [Hypholoma sublateritium FD-334 SS-4]|uniref:Uncharacterized protein n=1 Tax=Hypholoma sublateritium (strain FD-334 SS-4) TaxID=945553 RepID=A0A0D2NK09_HYPSF|nr:hypothetical protein HYPSUDRAFT_56735 [Hypholoma sublateritium FD-334 SS-4]
MAHGGCLVLSSLPPTKPLSRALAAQGIARPKFGLRRFTWISTRFSASNNPVEAASSPFECSRRRWIYSCEYASLRRSVASKHVVNKTLTCVKSERPAHLGGDEPFKVPTDEWGRDCEIFAPSHCEISCIQLGWLLYDGTWLL